MTLTYAQKAPELITYLKTRRSVKADDLTAPGPTAQERETILEIGSRVPDHGKLSSWYYLVFENESRAEFGQILKAAYAKNNPDARPDKLETEAQRFLRAPLVIAVICRTRPSKNPMWEQILTAGAVCMNTLLAANALGYGAQWLTEWYAYDPDVKAAMGLDERDHVAGFIYIGTPDGEVTERDRPDLSKITTHWSKDVQVQKGDAEYDRTKFDLPEAGFTLPK